MVKDKYVHNHITITQIYTIPGSGWHFAQSMDKQTYPWKCKPWINNNCNLQEKNEFELSSTPTSRYLYSEFAEQSLSHYQMQTFTLQTWQLINLSSSLQTFAIISRGTVCCGLPTSCLPQPSIHKLTNSSPNFLLHVWNAYKCQVKSWSGWYGMHIWDPAHQFQHNLE